MPIRIRRALPADAQALTNIMHASAAYSGRYASILDGYAVTPAQIDRDVVFLAAGEKAISGFYSLTLEHEPELDLMFVADGAQGTGLGGRLIDHMRTEARRRHIAAVRIVSHPPSVGFYQRMGATVIGTRPATARATWERPILILAV